ncbi:MAG: hypothetical protein HOK54_16095 [Alphaproteobacteria bacterium]|nr:hypothetical protein [Alphaproteobacteria bacterium]
MGETAIKRLTQIIRHQENQLSRLIARDENNHGFATLPIDIKDLEEKLKKLFKGFTKSVNNFATFLRASNYSLMFLSIVDQFDRVFITPRTIEQYRQNIRSLIEARGKFINEVAKLQETANSNP